MKADQRILTLYSSAPVKVSFTDNSEHQALGIGSICDLNTHRYTLFEEKPGSFKYPVEEMALVWGCALYKCLPQEAVDIQPYSRPQRGQPCMFSMLGELPGIEDGERFPLGDQWPLSCTDQERAFCLLQERIRKLWSEGWPDMEMRLALLSDYAGRLNRLGDHNFIHWDGDMLYAYCGSEALYEPLAYLCTQGAELKVDGDIYLSIESQEDERVVVIASRSLLPEGAVEIGPGVTCCFRNGELAEACEPVEFWAG